MIIKSNRMAIGGSARRLCKHLFAGDENDEVHVLQGGERDLLDAWRDARAHDAAFALRVWIVSPHEDMERAQLFELLAALADEFGFARERATVVEHVKARVTPDACDRHWHIAVGEVDPASGRILSSQHDHARHEYLARVHEAAFGHRHVLGAHTRAVLSRLRREGATSVVEALGKALEAEPGNVEERPREAFSTEKHQATKRQSLDLPELRAVVDAAWKASTSLSSLRAVLAEAGLTLIPGDFAGEWVVMSGVDLVGSLRRLTRVRKAAFAKRMKELIDGDEHGRQGQVLRRTDIGGDGGDQGGTRDPAPVREHHRPAADRTGGELHDGDDAPARPVGIRDGGNPSTSGSPEHHGGRPSHDIRAALGDPRRLINDIGAAATAAFVLIARAQTIARPMPGRIQATLDRQETAARAAAAAPTKPPVTIGVKALKALEKAARADGDAMSAEIDAINVRISALIANQRRHKHSPWRRWFPDHDITTALAGLREHRERLRASHALLAQARLRAEIAARDGASDMVRREARAAQERQAAHALAVTKLAILARARALLFRVPALAYVGARSLLRMATRIERAREQGWDPGPGTAPR